MQFREFLRLYDKSLFEEIEKRDKLISDLRAKIVSLEKANYILNEEITRIKKLKFWRVANFYYSLLERSFIFKSIATFFSRILFGSIKIVKRTILNKNLPRESNYERTTDFITEINEIILSSAIEKVIFFISPVKRDIPLYQRPQHLAKYLSSKNILYFYVVKYSETNYIKNVGDNYYEVGVVGLDLNFILEIIKQKNSLRKFYLQTYSTELEDINNLIMEFKKYEGKIIYEYIDEISSDISGMKIPEYVLSRFEECVKDEDNTFIITSAQRLYEDVNFYRKRNHKLVTNGVEFEHFNQEFTEKDLPLKMLRIYTDKKPIIGYYGAIASWMDYELLKFCAEQRPGYNFVLIGVDYDGSIKNAGLSNYNNIFILDPVPYVKLPQFAFFFDICTIPFKINDITKSTSPIKLFEYMALKKPIVTTDMPECRKYKSVFVSRNHQDYLKNIDKALKRKSDEEYLKLLVKEGKENTWNQKAEEIIELLDSVN